MHREVQPALSGGRPLLVAAAAVAALLLVYLSPLHDLVVAEGLDALRARLAGYGGWGPLAFVGLAAGLISIGAPRLAFSALAGVLFGWAAGFVLAHLATVAGAVLTFGWARWLGGGHARRTAGGRLARLVGHVEQHPVSSIVVVRLLPVGNNFATNVAFSLCPMSLRQFAAGTALGAAPQTLVFALFGSSAQEGSTPLLLSGALLFVAVSIVSWLLVRRSRQAAEVGADLVAQQAAEG